VSKIIISDEWIKQIALSQGINYDRIRRVIIDAKAAEPVVMYLEQYGDDSILALQPPQVVPAEVTE
jgi:hypothetical protein